MPIPFRFRQRAMAVVLPAVVSFGTVWFLVASQVTVSWAAPDDRPWDWAEGVEGYLDGATRDYFNRGARLPWRHRLGDWSDANGRSQGDEPFAAIRLKREHESGYVAWDVTDLVRRWQSRRAVHKGFFLRAESGTVLFASREASNPGARPHLLIQTASGERKLWPVADTYLSSSTYRPLGTEAVLRVSAGREHILIRFNRTELHELGAVNRAELRLFCRRVYGKPKVGVFQCEQQYPLAGPLETGIAQQFPGDEGIERHPAVWFAENFERENWRDRWSFFGRNSDIAVVGEDPVHGFEPLSGRALRIRIRKGSHYGLNIGLRFREILGREPDAAYFRYYLRLGGDWNQTVSGGKLPGFSGTYGRAGWGGRRSHGDDGWSARGLFLRTIPEGNPLGMRTPIGNYVYHAEMKRSYGEAWVWTGGLLGYLENNRWYCIEQFVRLNTPSKPDGVLRSWIDGRLAFERTDVRFRSVSRLRIEQVWLNIYHGGTATADREQHCYIDNVVVAGRYIGPLPRTLSGSGTE